MTAPSDRNFPYGPNTRWVNADQESTSAKKEQQQICILSTGEAEDLSWHIRMLMNHFTSNPNGLDNQCLFCYQQVEPLQDRINHNKDCDGERFLKMLDRAEKR
jgi:hypothetical protein